METGTISPEDIPFARSVPSPSQQPVLSSPQAPPEPPAPSIPTVAPVDQVAAPVIPDPPLPAKPAPSTDVTVASFSKLSQPPLPDVNSLLAASTALNEQITALQQQLHTTQQAMHAHDAEVSQTADQLRTSMRRLADRMNSTISGVARSRDEMDWNGLQNALQDVLGNPRDIGYATEFARRAADVDKVMQRYQGVLNTLAECNSLLRGLIGEEKA